MTLFFIVIGVILIYGLGYSNGRQSIRNKFDKLMRRKGR